MDRDAAQSVCPGRVNSAVMAALTQENIVKHEATHADQVLYFHSSEGDIPEENGVFMIGGVTTLSASKPKTCGIALAMVALFCYFPGISMSVSVVSTGITNKSGIGIVFLTVAVSLTAVSGILCCKNRRKNKPTNAYAKMAAEATTVVPSAPQKDQATAPLTSNRHDDVIYEKGALTAVTSPGNDLMLSKKISHSFVMKKYFEEMISVSGPFALDREQMDRLTEVALRDSMPATNDRPVPHKYVENTSSIDSAIEIESEPASSYFV